MIAALVLAAGLGTRMGASKPLLDIDGAPALARVLAAIDAAGVAPVVVVLGRDADAIGAGVDLAGRTLVRNPCPECGLSSSLALGLDAAPAACQGALIFHADMPFVLARTVQAVEAAGRAGARLAAPSFGGRRGFPVYIARTCFEALRAGLDGDSGARAFLRQNAADLRLVAVGDPGCVIDLDSPSDLAMRPKEAAWTTSA